MWLKILGDISRGPLLYEDIWFDPFFQKLPIHQTGINQKALYRGKLVHMQNHSFEGDDLDYHVIPSTQ